MHTYHIHNVIMRRCTHILHCDAAEWKAKIHPPPEFSSSTFGAVLFGRLHGICVYAICTLILKTNQNQSKTTAMETVTVPVLASHYIFPSTLISLSIRFSSHVHAITLHAHCAV